MLKAQVIGVGAAGNKAAIKLIEQKVVGEEAVLLVNSTIRDIPEKYLEICKISQIGGENNGMEGCGKEPEIAKKLCYEALQSGKLDLDRFILPDTQIVIVVASTEGGTGSGASVVIANYLRTVLGVNVHVFGFLGFEDDARGLLNTVNWFKGLNDDITVEAIKNKYFISNRGNYIKAEMDANVEFAIRTSILLGNPIMPSEQNIDRTDLYKLSTQVGYMNIEYKEIDEKIKNSLHFSQILKEMIDESKSLRPDCPSEKLLGVIINIPNKDTDNIDYSFKEIIDRYGKPFEKFLHIQSCDAMPTFIAFISSGMELPLDEVKEIYDKYTEATSRVNRNKNDFFSKLSGLEQDADDMGFNLNNRSSVNTRSKASFFSSYGTTNKEEDSDGLNKY